MADNVIDTLSLEIESNANNAEASIERLANSLKKLSGSLSGINISPIKDMANAVNSIDSGNAKKTSLAISSLKDSFAGFGDLSGSATSIQKVAISMQRLSGINTENFEEKISGISNGLGEFIHELNKTDQITFNVTPIRSVVSSLSTLSKINTDSLFGNISKLRSSLEGLSASVKDIKFEGFNVSEFEKLASSIAKLGGAAAGRAASGNIEKLAISLKNMMGTLSTAPKVSENLIQMTQALADLANSAGRISGASTNVSAGFKRIGSSASNAKKHILSLAAAFGKFYATYWLLLRGLGQFKKAIDISSDLTEVQNVVDITFGDMKQKVEDLAATSIQDFGMSELTAKQISSRFQAMGMAMGFAQGEMSDMSIELTKLAADMASFYNMEQAEVATKLQSIFTGESEPLRALGLDLTNATIQAWALAQGMDVNVNKMTQMEKAALRYQYVLANTAMAQGDFASTSMNWANQLRILTQQFQQLGGIVGGVLINAFKPFVNALNSVMQSVIKFAETVANALGAIFGWTFEINSGGLATDFEAAGAGAEEMDKGTGGAAKNLKDMNKYIAAWHEVNNMTTNDDAGKGGGGGGGSGGGGDLLGDAAEAQLIRTEGLLEKYKSEIDSLYELGSYISETLTNAMQGIRWEDIYEKAGNFGKGLADFLNGLINPGLFGALGSTIAGSLNTALHFLDSFGTEFDWKNFGASVAEGINKFFEKFDFKLLASTLNTWATGILDAAIEALRKTKWDKIGTKIGKFLEGIEFIKIGKKIGTTIWEAINAGFEFYKGMFETAPLETALLTLVGVTKLLKSEKVKTFVDSIKNGITYVTSFGKALGGGKTELAAFGNSFPKTAKFVDVLKDSFWALKAGALDGDWLTGISLAFENIRNNLSGTEKFAITAASAFGEFMVVKGSMKDIVTDSGNLLVNLAELVTAAGIAGTAMYTTLGPPGLAMAAIVGLAGAILGVLDGINEISDAAIGSIIADSLSSPGGKTVSEISDEYKGMFEEISGGYDELIQKSQEIEKVKTSAEETGKSIDKIKFAIENGAYTAEEKIPEMQQLFNQLLQESQSIFQEEYDLIIMGLAGSFGDALQDAGISLSEYTAMLSDLKSDVEQTYEEVSQSIEEAQIAYENGQISAEEYHKILDDSLKTLSNVTGETDKFSEAIQSVSDATGKVDFSEFINADNTLNLTALSDEMGTVAKSANEAKDTIKTAGDEYIKALEYMKEKAIQSGDTLKAAEIENSIKIYSESMSKDIDKVNEELVNFGNALQSELVDRIPSIVEQASNDWEKQRDESLWFRLFGPSKDVYVKKVVDEYQTEFIDPTVNEIQTMYDDAGIEISTWAGDAAKKATDAMFDSEYITDYDKVPVLKDAYVDAFNSSIEATKAEVIPIAEEAGGDISKSVGDGVEKNATVLTDATKELFGKMQAQTKLSAEELTQLFSNIAPGISSEFIGALSQESPSMQLQIAAAFADIATGARTSSEEVKVVFRAIGFEIPDQIIDEFKNQESNIQTGTIGLLSQIDSGYKQEVPKLIEIFDSLGLNIPSEIIESMKDMEADTQKETIDLLLQIAAGYDGTADELLQKFNDLGIALPNGLQEALESGNEETKNQVIELLGQIMTAEESERGALIERLRTLGVDLSESGLIPGMSSQTSLVDGESRELISTVTTAAEEETAAAIERFKGFGSALADGLMAGMMKKNAALRQAGANMINESEKGARDEGEIHSPSKLFERLGNYVIEGFNKGLEEETHSTYSIVENLMDKISKITSGFKINVPKLNLSIPNVDFSSGSYNLERIQTEMQMELDAKMAQQAFEIQQQNELLQEQNELLREILNKPIIQERDIFDANRRETIKFGNRTKKDPYPIFGVY